MSTTVSGCQPPGPSRNLVFDRAGRFLRVSLKDYLTESFAEHGDFVAYRFLNHRLYLIANPDDVEHVLHTNHRKYSKAVANYGALKRLGGEGLLTSEGPGWLRERKQLQPAFQRRHVTPFDSLITDATLGMLKRWQPLAAQGHAFDLLEELSRLILEILGRAFFGIDLSNDAAAVSEALMAANEYFGRFNVSRLLPFVPTRLSVRLRAGMRVLNRIADNLIGERRRSGLETADLLSALIGSEREAGAGSERRIRDHIVTLIFTGYETTATALCWTWYLLAQNPEVQRALSAELAGLLSGKPPSACDLDRLGLVRMIVEESLRLYPSAWLLLRSSVEEDEIRGCRIPKGSIMMISPYLTHRHPSFWRDPDQFCPERFSGGNPQHRHRFAYFPFGGGPRACIGSAMATMESQLILATVASHYRLELVPGDEVDPQALITLRPRHGLKVMAHPIEGC